MDTDDDDVDFMNPNDYFKDINHHLDPYLGSWTGTYAGGRYLELLITKSSEIVGSKTDILLIRYKITDANGQVLANTLQHFTKSKQVISGISFHNGQPNMYEAVYVGFEEDCGQSGLAILKRIENNQLSFFIIPDRGFVEKYCAMDRDVHILPTTYQTAVILTKQ